MQDIDHATRSVVETQQSLPQLALPMPSSVGCSVVCIARGNGAQHVWTAA